MTNLPDFSAIEESDDIPLVVHRHGDRAGRALIIFIHGLGGKRYKTWTPRDGDPTKASLAKFLYEDIPDLDVGLYAYRTLLRRLPWGKSLELKREAEVLADRVRDEVKKYDCILLAGHSMGGILARATIHELIDRHDRPSLEAIKGLFLLATPQAGSLRMPAWLSALSPDARALYPHNELVTKISRVFTDRIVSDRQSVSEGKFFIPTYVIAAAEDQWVTQFSAGLGVPSERTYNSRTSHTGAVKPRNREDEGYGWVREQVQELVEGHSGRPSGLLDVHDLGGKFFINRSTFRTALSHLLADEPGTRVIAVNGPAGSGKSHSVYLLEHAERTGGLEKVLVRLDRQESPVTMTPTVLARSVIQQMGCDDSRLPEPSVGVAEARWIQSLADYLTGQIRASRRQPNRAHLVCIVLDGFAATTLPTTTRQFIQELVNRATIDPNLRITLLDYSEDLLTHEATGRLVREPIDRFQDDDLRAFFRSYAHARGVQGVSSAAVTVILDSISTTLSAQDRARNARVAEQVQSWISQLDNETQWTTDTLRRLGQKIKAAPVPAASPRDERYHPAAALVTSFSLDPRVHIGQAAAHLEADSILVSTTPARRALVNAVRRRTLASLHTAVALRTALEANAQRPTDVVQRTLETWVARQPTPLDQQTVEELAATLQVIDWLADTELHPLLPDAEDVRARVEYAALLEPSKALVGPHFRGRELELTTLRNYVGVANSTARERPPLLMFGPGGMGKSTLMARFLSENTDRFPFVYLDFDRPGISAGEPVTLLAEAVRQLGLQFRALRRAAEQLRSRWLEEIARNQANAPRLSSLTAPDRHRYLEEFRVFVSKDLQLGDKLVLFMLDTFEEVQYRSPVAAVDVFKLLGELRAILPQLRTVVAGRNAVPNVQTESLEIHELDDEAAKAFLEARGVTTPLVRAALVRVLRGNPLSLQLAATAITADDAPIDDLERLTDDTAIQGALYNRILRHIHHDDIKLLAHPGLILRRITPELIRRVLAKPCGLGDIDESRAQELFALLEREMSLVTSEGNAVRHRADVRRVMLPALKKESPEKVRQIEEAAVLFYQSFDDLPSRAEELYHRLDLGQPSQILESRWLPGIEPSLYSATEEIAGLSRAWLSAKLGVELGEEDWSEVDHTTWEMFVSRRVEALLKVDQPIEALRLLRRRTTRLPDSPLPWLHVQALLRAGQSLEAGERTRQTIRAAAGDQEDPALAEQAIRWFTDPSLEAAPVTSDIVAYVKWLETLKPLYATVRSFVGRDAELAALADYVLHRSERPLLLISGMGGIGKTTLMSKFALERLGTLLLVYIDVELRANMRSGEFWSLLCTETVRQLAAQTPGSHLEKTGWEGLTTHAVPGGRTILLAIDGIDALTVYNTQAIALDRIFQKFQEHLPTTAIMLTSRASLLPFMPYTLHLAGLSIESVRTFLIAEGIEDRQTQRRVIELTQGNPFALRHAVDLLRAQGSTALDDATAPEGIGSKLLARLFDRIGDRPARAVAQLSILTRVVTPAVIQHVLAPLILGDGVTAEAAAGIFDVLAREVALYARDRSALRPRRDIRRVLNPFLRQQEPVRVQQLDLAAIAYYENAEDVPSRAEEIYHRLMLGQDAAEVDARWLEGIETLLAPDLDELPRPSRTYLATRLGMEVPEVDIANADQTTWERFAEKRAVDLIARRAFDSALDLLRQRSARLPRSRLFAIEANAHFQAGQPEEALRVAQRGLALWAGDQELIQLARKTEELVTEDSTRPPASSTDHTPRGGTRLRFVPEVDRTQLVGYLTVVMSNFLPNSTDVLNITQRLSEPEEVPQATSARELVLWAAAHQRLEELVAVVADYRNGSSRELNSFLQSHTRRVWAPSFDPATTVLLPNGTLIFGRVTLRTFLKGMLSDVPRYRAIIVNGPAGSGKSLTWRLTSAVASATARLGKVPFAPYRAYRVHCQDFTELGRVARQLADTLKAPELLPIELSTSPSRQAVFDFKNRLVQRLRQHGRCLLMFELDESGVSLTVTDFLGDLILDRDAPLLIITGMDPAALPAAARKEILVEQLKDLTEFEIQDGLYQVARELGLVELAVPARWFEAISRIAPGPSFNERVQRAASDQIERFTRFEDH